MTTNNAPWLDSEWIEHTARLLDSWEHWLDQPLITRSSPEQDAESLFQAPFVVVAHGTEVDPLLNYGNQAALELWDMTLDKFFWNAVTSYGRNSSSIGTSRTTDANTTRWLHRRLFGHSHFIDRQTLPNSPGCCVECA